jgi:hypothetical protein
VPDPVAQRMALHDLFQRWLSRGRQLVQGAVGRSSRSCIRSAFRTIVLSHWIIRRNGP